MKEDKPIIRSLLDVDFYKFTMGHLVFHHYPDVPVRYAFKNRTVRVPLAENIDIGQLREEFDAVRQLRFGKSEIHYLRGTNEYQERMFSEEYLNFLTNFQLPEYFLEKDGKQLRIEFAGKWSEAIYWETIGLAIINELYYKTKMKDFSEFEFDQVKANGVLRLAKKIRQLKNYLGITICDFGTRRRFSKEWQWYVIRTMSTELKKQFLGTSNTKAAMDYELLPMGTSAHEMDMAMSGIMHESDEDIRASHSRALEDWWNQYGQGLSIALTDTYGTDFFFQGFTLEQARNWKGLRHDSGDPFEFGEKAIKFYQDYNIDPAEKLMVFSDGLDIKTIIKLFERFNGRIKISFGWGTNLTNDVGFETLSLVVKLVESNGFGTVKLSDNLAKAIGDPDDIKRFKKIFGYTVETYTECKV